MAGSRQVGAAGVVLGWPEIFFCRKLAYQTCVSTDFQKKIFGGIGTPGVRILGIGTPGVPTLGIGRGGTYTSDLDFSRFAGIHGRVSSETLGISHKYHINIYGKGPVSI